MPTKIDTFTSNGNWTCPAGVSAVWATLIGGGSGAIAARGVGHADPVNFPNPAFGGGGSGEMLIGVPMKVTPGAIYTVVVGNGGSGAATVNTDSGPAGNSTFNGFRAYGSPGYAKGASFYDYLSTGAGGGWRGCDALYAGGYTNTGTNPQWRTTWSDNASSTGKRECWWGTGGNRGGCATDQPLDEYVTAANYDKTETSDFAGGTDPPGRSDCTHIAGASLGNHTYNGLADPLAVSTGRYWGAGGAGGSTILGGSMGCNWNVRSANANPLFYGSGAPGGGNEAAATFIQAGGNGASGIVQIMYIAP